MTQRELTADFEGLRLKPYKCSAGKLTIGYGHNIDAKPLTGDIGAYFRRTGCITEGMAGVLLDNDLADAKARLLRRLPWVARLDAVRQMVLIDMAFNMGLGRYDSKTGKGSGLLGFVNTLKLIEAGEYVRAAEAMRQSAWHKQTGRRAVKLCAMMRSGKIPSNEVKA